jgi:membrane-associated phospholipid phosphatase
MGSVARGGQSRTAALSRVSPAWLAAWATVLGLALALSALVMADGDPLPGDLRLTEWAQDLPAFHSIARFFRWGTGTEGVLILGGVAAIALWLARRPRESLALLAALVALRVMQPLIKNVVDRPRPSEEQVERRAGFSSESFPSGHMMSTFVLCGMLVAIAWCLPLPRWGQCAATAVAIVVVALNGTSSVYMGVHWPSDVAGGMLWALVIVVPAAWYLVVNGRQQ